MKPCSMTRGHFQFIADILADLDAPNAYRKAFADALHRTNTRFNRQRFLSAASPKPAPQGAMKYVCPKCEGSDVAMMADSWLNPNADVGSKFLSFVDTGYDNIFDGRAFRDKCNSCGWEQTVEGEKLKVLDD